ncbi:phosphatidylinositol 4-kinase gamma 4-like [Amaranthus tricolor]|uniref:phosphatidylinositol 4-kinase gamma 4-like n=1 Tax=Amaranthus tricolor TaxID=29722 RepID=UPI00258A565F|nr:phosphatidylinositol 4-kinase gamma 4-like [Amaranthus tricolor]
MSSAGLAVSRIRTEDPPISPKFFHNALNLNSDESIMVFLSVSGNVIPLRVFGSDSIESVKLKIQSYKGFYVKQQKLVCGGRELSRSNSMVRDYGVANGNVLHLVLRLSDLQTINVKTTCGKELTFDVGRYRNVSYVKKQIAKKVKGLVDKEDQELVYEGALLEDKQLVDDICKREDGVIHLLVRKSAKVRTKRVEKTLDELCVDAPVESKELGLVSSKVAEKEFELLPVVVNKEASVPLAVLDVMDLTNEGLECGNSPIRSSEGSGGVYLMQDSSGLEYVSVFKPIDEEPNARNNPHGLPLSSDGEGLKRGTRVGHGAFREVAAYLLDHPLKGRRDVTGEALGFAGVPPTYLVSCLHGGFNHPNDITHKIGSLQKFMKNDGSCEDIGPGSFPVEEVHKISVLDIRLANADRHAGNVLYQKNNETGQTVLIPIDHGYCLPECFEDCTFEWLYWPQARQPYSAETVEYIKSLDAKEDIALLKFYGWDLPVESSRTLHISTMLLKKGVERGLTPYDIGSIMCRVNIRQESVIEKIVQEALDSALPCSSEETFLETVSDIMDRHLDEMFG